MFNRISVTEKIHIFLHIKISANQKSGNLLLLLQQLALSLGPSEDHFKSFCEFAKEVSSHSLFLGCFRLISCEMTRKHGKKICYIWHYRSGGHRWLRTVCSAVESEETGQWQHKWISLKTSCSKSHLAFSPRCKRISDGHWALASTFPRLILRIFFPLALSSHSEKR